MKILYAVQATGNGHISRAMELLPYFKQFGEVDIFLSGDNSNLVLDAPVKYRSKGLSLYYNCKGGLDYWQITKGFRLSRIRKEVTDLPVEKYDLVINDFEYITAAACARKKVHSISFGHQASFQSSHTPRPETRNPIGEWVLKNYARASCYAGLHFKRYDNFIFPAIVKKEILEATPADKSYITVYLPSYCDFELRNLFGELPEFRFEIFCRDTEDTYRWKNITFHPVRKKLFNESLINCTGIITGAGFETPAEALHLGKKIMCIPIRGQYEQLCNAAALTDMGICCLKKIGEDFYARFYQWISDNNRIQADYSNSIEESLSFVFQQARREEEVEKTVTPKGLLSFLI